MRTASAIGFVAVAALSFCFPDFTVFRVAQAIIWAIALIGLVLLVPLLTAIMIMEPYRMERLMVFLNPDRDPQGAGFQAQQADTGKSLALGRVFHHAQDAAGQVRWPIVTGTSQSGNFVRSFIALGFNAGEDGRRIFDGANPNIAARQVPLNIRFGVPGGAAGLYEPGSEGALWWSRYDDRVRGRGTASLLDRCHADTTCPRIVETFGAAEFWGLRMSPNLIGTDARRELSRTGG